MWKYSWWVLLINKTWQDAYTIWLSWWQVKIDLTTVTNWVIVVRWDWKVIDANTWDNLISWTYWGLILLNETTPSTAEIADAISDLWITWGWLTVEQDQALIDARDWSKKAWSQRLD